MRVMAVVLGVSLCLAGWAQVPDVPATDLRVTDVAVFKHGYGFVLAEGQAKTSDGWTVLSEVPQASLGTLWFYSPQEGVTVDRAVAEVREVKQVRQVDDLDALIAANVGAPVTLALMDGSSSRTLQGTLLEPMLSDRPSPAIGYYDASRRAQPDDAAEAAIWAAVPPRPRAGEKLLTYVMLRTDAGDVAVPRNRVTDVSFGGAAKRETTVVRPEQRLAARLVRGGKTLVGEAPLGLGYLAKGLRWIPSYRLQLLKEGQARLQLQGSIINDVTDLKDSRLHLVVGVPHFVQQDALSPLSLQTAWTRLSSYFAAAQGRQQDLYSNALMSQAVVTGPAGPAGPRGDEGGTEALPVTGEAVEELFFYQVPDLTLKRGSRAAVTIFDAPVAYEDVYLLNIVDDANYAYRLWWPHYDRSQEQHRTPEQEALFRESLSPKVWHALRLKNATSNPWTTAPALLVRDWQPIAQSMMLYTPIGGSMDLTTTVAPDISSGRSDQEVGRKQRALSVSGTNYDQLTIRGELKLSNHKSKAVHLVVTRQFEGAVTESSDAGKAGRLAEYARGLNPTTQIVWDLTVAAGTEKTLTYSYTVYIPT